MSKVESRKKAKLSERKTAAFRFHRAHQPMEEKNGQLAQLRDLILPE